MAKKILIPLQSLVSCFLEPSMNRQAAMGAAEGPWQGLLFSVSQRLHQLLGPSSCCPSGQGVHPSLIFFRPRIIPTTTVCTGQVVSRFSGRLRGFLSTFSPLLLPPVHSSALLFWDLSPAETHAAWLLDLASLIPKIQ